MKSSTCSSLHQDDTSSINETLISNLQALVDRYGVAVCDRALNQIVSQRGEHDLVTSSRQSHLRELTRQDQPTHAPAPPFPAEYEVIMDDTSYEHKLIRDLAQLRVANYSGALESFRVQVIPSPALTAAIHQTVQHYYQQLPPPSEDNDAEQSHHPKSDTSERIQWKEFSLETNLNGVDEILNHPAMALFKSIDIDFQDEELIANPDANNEEDREDDDDVYAMVGSHLMTSLQRLFERCSPQVQRLSFGYCSMTSEDTAILRDLISSNHVKELALESVYLWSPNESMVHLESMCNERTTALEGLSMHFDDSWKGHHICRFARALKQLPNLKALDFSGDASLTQKILKEVSKLVSRSDSQLEELAFVWADTDLVDDHVPPEDVRNVGIGQLCKAIKSTGGSKTLRSFSVASSDLGIEDVDEIFRLAMDPNSPVENLCLIDLGIRRLADYSAMVELKDILKSAEAYKCKIRYMDLQDNELLAYSVGNDGFEGDEVEEKPRVFQNLCYLLELAEGLPCLSSIGLGHSDFCSTPTDMEYARIWRRLEVQLEENQVGGRVLLHPKVLPSIPVGLWSHVLARAANSQSHYYLSAVDQHRPPLNGLYQLVQRLIPSGILRNEFSSVPDCASPISKRARKK